MRGYYTGTFSESCWGYYRLGYLGELADWGYLDSCYTPQYPDDSSCTSMFQNSRSNTGGHYHILYTENIEVDYGGICSPQLFEQQGRLPYRTANKQ